MASQREFQDPKQNDACAKSPSASFPPKQCASKFLQLPAELRLEIYEYLFSSTRLVFGEQAANKSQKQEHAPDSPNALAILRTCRRMSADVSNTWLGTACFYFEDPVALLNTLAGLPISTRSHIRHVELAGGIMWCCYEKSASIYYLDCILNLLPGLQLDTLTIFGSPKHGVRYEILDRLVRHSNGWKELRFQILTSSLTEEKNVMLIPRMFAPRSTQPLDWQNTLNERDGSESNPFVAIYTSIETYVPGISPQPPTRNNVVQAQSPEQSLLPEDIAPLLDNELPLRLWITAKRGEGVDYVEKGTSECIEDEVPCDHDYRKGCRTWQSIKTAQSAGLVCLKTFPGSR